MMTKKLHEEIDVSIAVPLFNEEESAPILYSKLKEVLDSQNLKYEIIFVDDGSGDGTFNALAALAANDNSLRVIKFRQNFGQTPAMAAGIDNARGKIIVTMDGDLQNDPRDIPKFLKEIHSGFDIVVGWRRNRKDKLITRKIPSRVANWLIGKVTGVPIKDNGCSLKAYRASVIKKVSLYSEMHRFIPAMANIAGASVKEIEVRHHARQYGVSKYGLSRIYRVLIDLAGIATIRAASSKPGHWFAILAAPFLVVGLLILGFSIFTNTPTSDYSVIFGGAGLSLVALAVSLLFSGVLVELIVHSGEIEIRNLFQTTMRLE